MVSYNIWPFVTKFFHLDNVFKVYPCFGIYQYFILFYGWKVLHCMDVPHCVYPFIHWAFVLFPHVAVNIHVQTISWTPVFTLYLGVELLDHWYSVFNWVRNCQIVSLSVSTISSAYQQCTNEGSNFSHPHQHLFLSILKNYFIIAICPVGCAVVSQCGYLLFPNEKWCLESFHVFIGKLVYLLQRNMYSCFCSFLSWVICLFVFKF